MVHRIFPNRLAPPALEPLGPRGRSPARSWPVASRMQTAREELVRFCSRRDRAACRAPCAWTGLGSSLLFGQARAIAVRGEGADGAHSYR